jgi:hypothetical protein
MVRKIKNIMIRLLDYIINGYKSPMNLTGWRKALKLKANIIKGKQLANRIKKGR